VFSTSWQGIRVQRYAQPSNLGSHASIISDLSRVRLSDATTYAKPILGVTASKTADDADDPITPPKLLRALGASEHFVFGDFEVCPFTPERPGAMQMVCVERADNLVIKPILLAPTRTPHPSPKAGERVGHPRIA
jgi:hypothetical protein